MIIFDLDMTLADCEHRRHFIDPRKDLNLRTIGYKNGTFYVHNLESPNLYKWKPDWQSFYEACSEDKPIEPVIDIWNDQISLGMMGVHQIWSGRCESVRNKTVKWLDKHLLCFNSDNLKMRPIGDYTPDDILKEQWLNQRCADLITAQIEGRNPVKHDIEFVFDSCGKSIRMWQRRGIFVFNCNQTGEEF